MMANLSGGQMSVNASDAMRGTISVEVFLTGLRWWNIKARAALVFFRIGAWLLDSDAKVSVTIPGGEEPDEQT